MLGTSSACWQRLWPLPLLSPATLSSAQRLKYWLGCSLARSYWPALLTSFCPQIFCALSWVAFWMCFTHAELQPDGQLESQFGNQGEWWIVWAHPPTLTAGFTAALWGYQSWHRPWLWLHCEQRGSISHVSIYPLPTVCLIPLEMNVRRLWWCMVLRVEKRTAQWNHCCIADAGHTSGLICLKAAHFGLEKQTPPCNSLLM